MMTHGPGLLRTRLVLPVSLVVGVVIVGTFGYHWLWRGLGGTWLDALFMTVTTITTIGYGEVKPLSGAGRIFTMGIAVAGIGAFFYTFSVVLDHLVETGAADPRRRRRMERRIAELDKHVIVAGLGRVGRQAATELAEAGTPFGPSTRGRRRRGSPRSAAACFWRATRRTTRSSIAPASGAPAD
jgi:voltage-gated potassium channel